MFSSGGGAVGGACAESGQCPLCGTHTKHGLLMPIKEAVDLPHSVPLSSLEHFVLVFKSAPSMSSFAEVSQSRDDILSNKICLACVNLLGSCMLFCSRQVQNKKLQPSADSTTGSATEDAVPAEPVPAVVEEPSAPSPRPSSAGSPALNTRSCSSASPPAAPGGDIKINLMPGKMVLLQTLRSPSSRSMSSRLNLLPTYQNDFERIFKMSSAPCSSAVSSSAVKSEDQRVSNPADASSSTSREGSQREDAPMEEEEEMRGNEETQEEFLRSFSLVESQPADNQMQEPTGESSASSSPSSAGIAGTERGRGFLLTGLSLAQAAASSTNGTRSSPRLTASPNFVGPSSSSPPVQQRSSPSLTGADAAAKFPPVTKPRSSLGLAIPTNKISFAERMSHAAAKLANSQAVQKRSKYFSFINKVKSDGPVKDSVSPPKGTPPSTNSCEVQDEPAIEGSCSTELSAELPCEPGTSQQHAEQPEPTTGTPLRSILKKEKIPSPSYPPRIRKKLSFKETHTTRIFYPNEEETESSEGEAVFSDDSDEETQAPPAVLPPPAISERATETLPVLVQASLEETSASSDVSSSSAETRHTAEPLGPTEDSAETPEAPKEARESLPPPVLSREKSSSVNTEPSVASEPVAEKKKHKHTTKMKPRKIPSARDSLPPPALSQENNLSANTEPSLSSEPVSEKKKKHKHTKPRKIPSARDSLLPPAPAQENSSSGNTERTESSLASEPVAEKKKHKHTKLKPQKIPSHKEVKSVTDQPSTSEKKHKSPKIKPSQSTPIAVESSTATPDLKVGSVDAEEHKKKEKKEKKHHNKDSIKSPDKELKNKDKQKLTSQELHKELNRSDSKQNDQKPSRSDVLSPPLPVKNLDYLSLIPTAHRNPLVNLGYRCDGQGYSETPIKKQPDPAPSPPMPPPESTRRTPSPRRSPPASPASPRRTPPDSPRRTPPSSPRPAPSESPRLGNAKKRPAEGTRSSDATAVKQLKL